MNSESFQIYFDCGFSKLRAGAFNKKNDNEAYFIESEFFINHSNLDIEIQDLITSLEKKTGEYINNINLMIDSSKMLSISISISKILDGSDLRQEDIQFLIQEAKQQILKHHRNRNIIHIIINNYKINDVDYSYLPQKLKCSKIFLDILFICLPNEVIEYYKDSFLKSNISINQIICSSYAKSINYRDNLNFNGNVSFVDVGFNKTSVVTYVKDKINSVDTLPIGGNHITKDISKILKIDLEQAEDIKLNFNKDQNFFNEKNFSLKLLQKIIFARTEEILELCNNSTKTNFIEEDQFKLVLMGDGSKILDNQYVDKISFAKDIDFVEETNEDVCRSGFKLGRGINKQEVVVAPKKQNKQGFFEKLFHTFK